MNVPLHHCALHRVPFRPPLSFVALLVAWANNVGAAPPGESPADGGRPGGAQESAPKEDATSKKTATPPESATVSKGAAGNADGAEASAAARPNTDVPPSPGKRPENGYWSEGEPRWFISTKSDLGAPYVKPYFSAGYGLPHWIWAGVDLNLITTGEFTQVYGGVRATSPVLDFAFGVRDTWSFGKPFLAPKATFTRDDVLNAPGSKSRYWAWEAEVVGVAPLPYSALLVDFIVVRMLDVPAGSYLYEESYRAVVADPTYAILRVAAVARVMREGALKFGPLVEHVFGTGRDAPITRVGPAGALQLTDHLEVNAALTLAVSSPDSLGLALGAYGVAGLRYRWATGERSPKWPWQGQLVP
jgi:uncharacterized protein (DUF697 family)